MLVFETNRLLIKTLEKKDEVFFYDLLTNPHIIEPIPQPRWSDVVVKEKFNTMLNFDVDLFSMKKIYWGVFEKGNSDLIGLALFLTDEQGERELGYRFREVYWGKGYGSETTKGIIDYAFLKLGIHKITASVNTENPASSAILDKYLFPVKECYNEEYQFPCRYYALTQKQWFTKRL